MLILLRDVFAGLRTRSKEPLLEQVERDSN